MKKMYDYVTKDGKIVKTWLEPDYGDVPFISEEHKKVLNMQNKQEKLDYTLAPPEFDDVVLVFQQVLKSGKYPKNDWLDDNVINEEDNQSSIKRHLRDARLGVTKDKESGLDPYLHAACRCLMMYTLRKRTV